MHVFFRWDSHQQRTLKGKSSSDKTLEQTVHLFIHIHISHAKMYYLVHFLVIHLSTTPFNEWGMVLGVDPILAHISQEAVIAWRSPIYHQANTDNHTLTFTFPVSFIVSNFPNMYSADLRLLKSHREKECTFNLQRKERLWFVKLEYKSSAS